MGSTNVRVGSTIFSARQPKQPSSANAAGGIPQQSPREIMVSGGTSQLKTSQGTNPAYVRNKTLFLRKVSMSTSSDNVCDKNSGFAGCGYMRKRYIEHYIICCPNQGCWCSIDSMPRKLNCFNASASLPWVNTSNVMKYVLE